MSTTEMVEGTGGGELITDEDMQRVMALDQTVRESRTLIDQADKEQNLMLKGMIVARATQKVRDLLTPDMMTDVMQLMGSPLGFRTDRDHTEQGYSPDQVKDALIVALVKGFQPVNNEFNIIGGNFYAAQQGLERVVREWPELTDLVLKPGVPVFNGEKSGAFVPYRASWRLGGTEMDIECIKFSDDDDRRICVRCNKGQGADAILGKAKRKMLARIYERLTGSAISHGDASDPKDAEGVVDGSVVESPGEETPQDETPSEENAGDGDFSKTVEADFAMAESILQCNDCEQAWIQNDSLADQERELVQQTAEARRKAIRSKRGGRNNKEAAQAAS